ncbi:MAG: CapA family protein, partial [Anaerolineaceae bacterium]|nr:CapA family protein [Anaerolineaceae bacterium]
MLKPRSLFLIVFLFLSACQPAPTGQQVPLTPTGTVTPAPLQVITGRVVDREGKPVADAIVHSENFITQSDTNGWFTLVGADYPMWVTVIRQGFLSRTRAAAPGTPALFRLAADDGKTIVLHFAGDTMFGRRFYDPNDDGYPADGLLPEIPTADEHSALLKPIQPLLENADLTVVNFESPLTDAAYGGTLGKQAAEFNQTKVYSYSSHTSSIQALKDVGVDAIDLGNNHSYDLLEEGLAYSMQAINQADLGFFGAGKDEASAWRPYKTTIRGQHLALIGCTTISAPPGLAKSEDIINYVASDALGKGGAAKCEENTLREAVTSARADGSIVIVMVHGGYEYDRRMSPNVTKFSEIARDAGAVLVINHHPHVVGGLQWSGSTLLAESMGNFIFDQTLWPTYETYLLEVTLQDGKIIQADVEPLVIQDYIPRGLTGKMADYVARGAAGRTPGQFILENGAAVSDFSGKAIIRTYLTALDGGKGLGLLLSVPTGQWISAFN